MRKLYLLILLLGISVIGFGQNLQYGIKTGLGFATEDIADPNVLSKNSITTYFISGFVEKPYRNGFYLQTGLGVSGKGVTTYDNSQTSTYSLTYLDIPLNVLRKFILPALGKLYVGAGPYLSVGLSGNVQYQNTNNTTGADIEFGSDKDYRRLDAGVNVIAGFELNNHLTFNTGYAFGLTNLAPNNPDDGITSIKNRVFTIGLGFLF